MMKYKIELKYKLSLLLLSLIYSTSWTIILRLYISFHYRNELRFELVIFSFELFAYQKLLIYKDVLKSI